MYRKVAFAPGETYHLYNRGVDKRDIFLDQGDHIRFVALLHAMNSQEPVQLNNILAGGKPVESVYNEKISHRLVSIGAYCLMPNHFHLLVKECVDGGISTFMKKLGTAYVMYFNTKYQRKGALFEGRFKSIHAGDDRYLKYLYSYIHLNPVKLIEPRWKDKQLSDPKQAEVYINSYRFSSYLDYKEESRPESIILDPSDFPDYFSTAVDLDGMINSWLIEDGP